MGDCGASLINENELRGTEIQRFEKYRIVAPAMDVDDIGVSDQDGLIGPIEQEHRACAERQYDGLVRGRGMESRSQEQEQRKGASAKDRDHRNFPNPNPPWLAFGASDAGCLGGVSFERMRTIGL
jgi:hypothetical protein